MAITDAEGVITYVNDQFCDISQYKRHELIGQTHRMLNAEHHEDAFFKHMWETIKSGEVWKGH